MAMGSRLGIPADPRQRGGLSASIRLHPRPKRRALRRRLGFLAGLLAIGCVLHSAAAAADEPPGTARGRFGIGIPFAQGFYAQYDDEVFDPAYGYALSYLYQPFRYLGFEARIGFSTAMGVRIPELRPYGIEKIGNAYRYPLDLTLTTRPFTWHQLHPYLSLGCGYCIINFSPVLDIGPYLPPKYEDAIDPVLSLNNAVEMVGEIGVEWRVPNGIALYLGAQRRMGTLAFDLDYLDDANQSHTKQLTTVDMGCTTLLFGVRFYPWARVRHGT
jgi:hypothetical protein